jgi:hypothetical protein
MPEEDRRTEPVTIRLSKSLRAQLEQSRKSSNAGRSLSHEIELRLKQSFDLDGQIKKRFGSTGTYWILQLIANGILLLENNVNRGRDDLRWLDDRFMFEQVEAIAATVFDHFRPTGKRTRPAHMRDERWKDYGRQIALYLIASLEFVGPNPALDGAPTFIFSASTPLHRRIRKSAIKEQATQPIISEIRKLRKPENEDG